MRIIEYLPNSIVDGCGLRQVFYLAGCTHYCKGCHNPQTWNPNGGSEWSIGEVVEKALESPYNVTFSGGDPLYQINQLKSVCKQIRANKSIWVYTGYTFEEIMGNDSLRELIPLIDVLVDGRFDFAKRDTDLTFRGSSNQRIIDCKESLKKGDITLWRNGDYI